jgi:hypothetical protein
VSTVLIALLWWSLHYGSHRPTSCCHTDASAQFVGVVVDDGVPFRH